MIGAFFSFLAHCILTLLYLGIIYQILLSNKSWGSKLFWLFFVTVPLVGPIIYSLAGIDYRRDIVRERMHGRTLRLFRQEMTEDVQEGLFHDRAQEKVEPRFAPLASLVRSVGEGNKVYDNTQMEIITSGPRKRELLLKDLREARHSIHLEYFRFTDDESGREVQEVLKEKAREGVQVRFIENNIINHPLPQAAIRALKEAGVEVLQYTDTDQGLRQWIMHLNHQNHRKIVVIDGKIAYTGGMNINDHYFKEWRDTHLRLIGPVVARLQASFLDTWMVCDGQLSSPLTAYFSTAFPAWDSAQFSGKLVQVECDAAENRWMGMLMAYEWMLQHAKDYVYIQSPYFMPPEAILDGLKSAALRGVDVRLMMPKKTDTPLIGPGFTAYYEECMEAGVRVYEHDGAFLHAKTLVMDDYLAVIGASNLDWRSFDTNNECNTLVYDKEVALHCKEIFMEDLASAHELSLDTWRASRTLGQNLIARFIRLFYKVL